MSNDQHDNNNSRSLPFSHFGTTIQNVFRNINHAFTSNHDSTGGQQRGSDSQNPIPPLEPSSAAGGRHDTRATDTANPLSNSTMSMPNPNPSISSSFSSAGPDIPPVSQSGAQQDDDEDYMSELRSVTDSDYSDASIVFNPVPLHPNLPPIDDGRWINGQGDIPPRGSIAGTRRARVDDDEDDARDRRHPSERVGGSPPGDGAPQNTNPQQPHPPTGFFGAVFGLGPPGGHHPGGDVPPGHAQAGDPSAASNNAPGPGPRGPVLTAGFTLTIPLFGQPPGTTAGGLGGGMPPGMPGMPGMSGMDAAAREDLFATFAAIFQEFQALEEGREDPERAKKLVAALEVVPFGLVKRLERVGGAPGGHIGEANAEGSSSGCAICWDTLLDAESDSFRGLRSSGDEVPQPSSSGTDTIERQVETRAVNDAMEVDASSVPVSEPESGTPTPAPTSSEPAKIICLPCAHVFHASCLLPWFTRAKQATCPTCRFNIDPENLTYTPPLPRQVFNRAPPAQPDNANLNPMPAVPQPATQVPSEGPGAAAPPVDHAHPIPVPDPAANAAPPGQMPNPLFGQAPGGVPNVFDMGGIPIPMMAFPPIQIPLRPPTTQTQAPVGGNQDVDILTIGLDMFIGGPPEDQGGEPRDQAQATADDANRGATTADRNGAPNPNGLTQDLHMLIEGLVRTTRNIIPQVVNPQGHGQGPVPGAAPGAPPVGGAQSQPQAEPIPEGTQPQLRPQPHPIPPPPGGPRIVPIFPLRPNMFRPTRPMPPRRERKTWTLPPAPGPSLRQRVEQREREEGLRCSDTSCGIGPSDDDPYPGPTAPLAQQVQIRPLSENTHEGDGDISASVCAHAFHPACLVSAERVAGWGDEDKGETTPLVEVSCPVCRAVGCVTREEWALGVAAL